MPDLGAIIQKLRSSEISGIPFSRSIRTRPQTFYFALDEDDRKIVDAVCTGHRPDALIYNEGKLFYFTPSTEGDYSVKIEPLPFSHAPIARKAETSPTPVVPPIVEKAESVDQATFVPPPDDSAWRGGFIALAVAAALLLLLLIGAGVIIAQANRNRQAVPAPSSRLAQEFESLLGRMASLEHRFDDSITPLNAASTKHSTDIQALAEKSRKTAESVVLLISEITAIKNKEASGSGAIGPLEKRISELSKELDTHRMSMGMALTKLEEIVGDSTLRLGTRIEAMEKKGLMYDGFGARLDVISAAIWTPGEPSQRPRSRIDELAAKSRDSIAAQKKKLDDLEKALEVRHNLNNVEIGSLVQLRKDVTDIDLARKKDLVPLVEHNNLLDAALGFQNDKGGVTLKSLTPLKTIPGQLLLLKNDMNAAKIALTNVKTVTDTVPTLKSNIEGQASKLENLRRDFANSRQIPSKKKDKNE